MKPDKRTIRSVACVGEVMIELVASQDGTARLGVAGDTFNTAVYMNRLLKPVGCTLSYVTALGRDPYSDRIVAAIDGHGIATDMIERRDGLMPGLYAIDTDAGGERHFSYWRSTSAARTLFAEPCEIGLDRLDRFDLVFLSGITLAILPPQTRRAILEWIDRFREGGGTVAYDNNHRPRLWESVEVAREVNMALWSRVDIALPSLDDEQALFGDVDEAQVLARLQTAGVTRGALKRGARGPLDVSGRVGIEVPATPVKVVDTTAAGDSFNAGYLAAVISGAEDGAAMLAGHELAARVIAAPGAILPE